MFENRRREKFCFILHLVENDSHLKKCDFEKYLLTLENVCDKVKRKKTGSDLCK